MRGNDWPPALKCTVKVAPGILSLSGSAADAVPAAVKVSDIDHMTANARATLRRQGTRALGAAGIAMAVGP